MLTLAAVCMLFGYGLGLWIGRSNGYRYGRDDERKRLRALLCRRTRSDWRGRSKALDLIPQHQRN
jgi:hypothetical protein